MAAYLRSPRSRRAQRQVRDAARRASWLACRLILQWSTSAEEDCQGRMIRPRGRRTPGRFATSIAGYLSRVRVPSSAQGPPPRGGLPVLWHSLCPKLRDRLRCAQVKKEPSQRCGAQARRAGREARVRSKQAAQYTGRSARGWNGTRATPPQLEHVVATSSRGPSLADRPSYPRMRRSFRASRHDPHRAGGWARPRDA